MKLPALAILLTLATSASAATLYVDFDGDDRRDYVVTETPGLDRDAILAGIRRNFATPPVLLPDGTIKTMPGLALDVIAGDASQPLFDGESLAIIIGEPPFPQTVGGWAYVNAFRTYLLPNIAYVWPSYLGRSTLNIWQAATHEAGHVLGLSHPPEGYVPGRLMGLAYSPDAVWTLDEYMALRAVLPEPVLLGVVGGVCVCGMRRRTKCSP